MFFVEQIYDPRISRIEQIFAKFSPKFLDLYASIYGNLIWTMVTFFIMLFTFNPLEAHAKARTYCLWPLHSNWGVSVVRSQNRTVVSPEPEAWDETTEIIGLVCSESLKIGENEVVNFIAI